MELVDIPGMSPIFRICRLGTCNQKNTKVDLRDPNRVLKIGPPKIWVGDQFGMVGGPLRIKPTHSRNTFAPHCVEGFTVGRAQHHYRLLDFYIPATRGYRLSGTYRL